MAGTEDTIVAVVKALREFVEAFDVLLDALSDAGVSVIEDADEQN